MDPKNSVPVELGRLPLRLCTVHTFCVQAWEPLNLGDLFSFSSLILILHCSLLTATLSLIIVFRIYDHHDKCFCTQRVLITITSQKSSQLWLKETEVTCPVRLTEAVPKAERDPWAAWKRRRWPRTVPHTQGVPKLLLTFFGNIFLGKAFKPWLLKGLLQPLPSYNICSSLVHESNPCLPSHLQGYYETSYTEIFGNTWEPCVDMGEITSSTAQRPIPSSLTFVKPYEQIGGRIAVRKYSKILYHSKWEIYCIRVSSVHLNETILRNKLI